MNLADHFNLLCGGGPVIRIVNGIHYITFTPQQIHMHGTSTWLLIPRAMVLWWIVPARFMDVALSGEQAVNVVASRCRSECGDGALPGLRRSLGYHWWLVVAFAESALEAQLWPSVFGRVRKSLPGRPKGLHGTCLRAQVRKRDRNDEIVAAKCAANIIRNNGDNINRMVR